MPADPRIEWLERDNAKAKAEIARLTAALEVSQRNNRDTFGAMCAMRNAINERIPMASLESDLLQGPENSVFCATVAEAVITHIDKLTAKLQAMQDHVIHADAYQAAVMTNLNRAEKAEADLAAARAETAMAYDRNHVEAQISEGIGAILRKFCESDHAAKARHHLHAMPDSDWNTLVSMLADAVISTPAHATEALAADRKAVRAETVAALINVLHCCDTEAQAIASRIAGPRGMPNQCPDGVQVLEDAETIIRAAAVLIEKDAQGGEV